ETGGPTAADASGRGVTGTYQAGVTFGTPGGPEGDADTAISSAGGPAVVTTNASRPTGNAARTYELWLRSTVTPGGTCCASPLFSDNDISLAIFTTAGIDFITGTGNHNSTLPYVLNDGAWHLVDLTYSNQVVVLYLDGQQFTTFTVSAPL